MEADAFRTPWPLVGRSEELLWTEHVLQGQGGVVIAGAPGVGKTRLAAEVAARTACERTLRIAGSTSLAAVPLGAFAVVLPAASGAAPRQPMESLRWAAGQITGAASSPPLVWVDDAHLLDELSAGLVLELAASRRAVVLVTIRSDEPCPDAVQRPWRDGHARRLDLQPLGVDDVGEILRRVLGAPMDGATHQRIWKASGGNLLYLRELVRIGLDSGALARRGEVWIWEGPLRVSPELRELIAERFRGLDAATRDALETVAATEPLTPAIAAQLGLSERLVALETQGLLQVDAGASPTTLRLAHPLFGQVLREGLSSLRAAELARAHAAALAASGDDLLRLAIAQADGLFPADPALLLDATMRARVLSDHALATRLARAAVAAGGGGRAIVVTSECLFWEQRYTELLELLDANPIEPLDVDSRIIALHNRASALYWGFGRADEAIATLMAAEALDPNNPFAAQAAGQRAVVLSNDARSQEAIVLARRILDAPDSRAPEKVYAYSAITIALAATGHFDEALAEAQRGMPLALQIRDELPAAGGGMLVGASISWFLSGAFGALEAVIGPIYRASAEIGDPFLGLWAHFLARGDLTRGRLEEADRRASEAVALLRLHDPGLVLPWALAVLAQIAAQRGDAVRARDLVLELERRPCRMASCQVEIEAARAWSDAASGRLAAARRRMSTAARAEADAGRHGFACVAAHEATRLGLASEALPLLASSAERVDGPLAAAWLRQTRALVERDAGALEAVAEELAALDLMLDASEAAAAAAEMHRDAGLRGASHRAAARGLELAAPCGAPRTPLLSTLRADPASALSARELHIARLAARGATRREIAQQLDLSARTVGNHLNRIYGKLGVADRTALATLLGETGA